MSALSALYAGSVTHQRLRPRRHRLRYRVFSLLLDLDELPALAQRLKLFSLNRFNLFSIQERDYGNGDARSLRAQVDARLQAAGLQGGGAVRLLTMPRILGHAFNPINVYFCDRPEGGLQAIVYEVNNTFGERHCYLLEVAAGGDGAAPIRQECAKDFHVSPFLGLQMRYGFRVHAPGSSPDALRIGITARDDRGAVLHAAYAALRQPLDDAALVRAFLSIPFLTLKVVAGIHWEALRLWLKGVPVHAHPSLQNKKP